MITRMGLEASREARSPTAEAAGTDWARASGTLTVQETKRTRARERAKTFERMVWVLLRGQ